jgi:hypothetical protein
MAHLRGFANLTCGAAVWVLQAQGQEPHRWPALHELPLFTLYLVSQYEWMEPVRLRSTWPVLCEGLCPWTMTEPLMRAFVASARADELPEGDRIGPRDIFGVRRDGFFGVTA